MPRISFYGAVGTVTGSRFVFDTQGQKLLVDAGMFQGLKKNRMRNWELFSIPPPELDAVFLTHAHIDHSGFLPRLVKNGFRGPVYCTHATRELCDILLHDTAHLQEEDAWWANKKGFSKHEPALPLYTKDDVEETMKLFRPQNYGEGLFLTPDLRVKFKDAGHILGSSFIEFKTTWNDTTRKILFSGDLGRPDQPILRNPTQAFNVDYLVVESTYGNRLHGNGHPVDELARVINESAERGGALVIPSFAVGRTQTILYVLRELEESGKIPSMQVFLDSPMAIDATRIFEKHQGDYDYQARILELRGQKILQPKRLRVCKTREQSMAINDYNHNSIIISASGMATGGRILHHLANRLPNDRNTVLFIGYQAEGTRGRTILEGKEEIKIHGQQVPVRAKIENISGFSAHADYEEILSWLMGFNHPPRKTFIVHGERDASLSLATKIKQNLHWDVEIPVFEQTFELE